MAKQEIILKGLDGHEDHLVYNSANGQVGNSLEECARSLFPQEGETTPRLRFQGFEGEWQRVCFGDLYEHCIVKNDLTYGKDKIISVANMYYIQDANVSDDDYLRTYNVFKLGDIAFEGNKSKNFAHGRFVENTIGDGIVSHVFEVFRPKSDNYDLMFWKYAINNEMLMGKILSRCTKASTMMTNLVAQDFLKESILVPSLEEQQKIGSFLQRLDAQMALHKQQYERLQQLKSACLNSMFPQPSENNPPIRFSGYEGEWVKIKLSDIAKFSKGAGYSKNDLSDTGEPIILYGRMYTKYESMIRNVDTFAKLRDNSVLSKGNEIIIPASGETPEDIACASVVSIPNVILGGDLNVIRLDSKYDPVFTALSITYGEVHNELAKYAQGKTIVHLHNAEISKVSISYPQDVQEQRQISNYFLTLDTQISTEQQRLERLKQMKSACLRSMFPVNGGG